MKNNALLTGRVQQKQATRNRILETAQQLLQTKPGFSLDDVAQASGISRATVYRYYSSVDFLCTEATLSYQAITPADLAHETQGLSLLDALLHVQRYFNRLVQQQEPMFRKYLSVVLAESATADGTAPPRGARRPATLELVLQAHAPHLTPQQHERLRQITTVLSGIEPLIVNKDVNGLSSEESHELLEWALRMVVKGMNCEP